MPEAVPLDLNSLARRLDTFLVEAQARAVALDAVVMALLIAEATRTPGFTKAASKFLDAALQQATQPDDLRTQIRAREVFRGWLEIGENAVARQRATEPPPGSGFWQRLGALWGHK